MKRIVISILLFITGASSASQVYPWWRYQSMNQIIYNITNASVVNGSTNSVIASNGVLYFTASTNYLPLVAWTNWSATNTYIKYVSFSNTSYNSAWVAGSTAIITFKTNYASSDPANYANVSNMAFWASNNTLWASNTALWASNAALWASNNAGGGGGTSTRSTNGFSGMFNSTGIVNRVVFPESLPYVPVVITTPHSNAQELATIQVSNTTHSSFDFTVYGTDSEITNDYSVTWLAVTNTLLTSVSTTTNIESYTTNNYYTTNIVYTNGSGSSAKRFTLWCDEATSLSNAARVVWHDALQNYGYYLSTSANGTSSNGDAISWSFVSDICTGTVSILALRYTNNGKVDLLVDGSVVATGIDLYGSSVYNTTYTTNNISITNSGIHTFVMRVNGKNASSGGYQMNTTKLWFKPTSD